MEIASARLPKIGGLRLGLVLIASVCIGFAVADGRPKVIAIESGVASVFVTEIAIGGPFDH